MRPFDFDQREQVQTNKHCVVVTRQRNSNRVVVHDSILTIAPSSGPTDSRSFHLLTLMVVSS